MARSRKTGSAGVTPPPTPQSSAPPVPVVPPPVRLWTADAGDDGCLALFQDTVRGILLMAPADPEKPLRLGKPAREFLRQNGFAEETAGGPWTRPMDRDADFQDRLDAERVLLKVAELHRGDGPTRPSGRRGR